MTINLIIILGFIFVLIILVVTGRNSTIDKLSSLPGEEVLFEEKNIKVIQAGAPRTAVFINCIVRVTSCRIIIGQKFFLSKEKYALRFVIIYKSLTNLELETQISRGYLNMQIDNSSIKLNPENKQNIVRIIIPESLFTGSQYLEFFTSDIAKYQKIFV